MTMKDEYLDRRQYGPLADTTPMVKCITCEGMFPEDEAVLYEGAWQCHECAEHSGLRRCVWCGEVDMVANFIMRDDGPWHQKCIDEMEVWLKTVAPFGINEEAHIEAINLAAERSKDEAMREDAAEERRELARAKMDEARRGR